MKSTFCRGGSLQTTPMSISLNHAASGHVASYGSILGTACWRGLLDLTSWAEYFVPIFCRVFIHPNLVMVGWLGFTIFVYICVFTNICIYIYIMYVNLRKVEWSSFCLKHCKSIFSDFLLSDLSMLVKYDCLTTIAICIYYLLFTIYCCYISTCIFIHTYFWLLAQIYEHFEWLFLQNSCKSSE